VAVVEASAHSSAPRDAVWAVVADLKGWKDWGPWDVSDVLESGSPDPNGEGALRLMRSSERSMGRRPKLHERVNVFEPPMRFGYTLVSGVPLKDYQATITLTEAGEGTEIVWRLEFEGKFPGAAALARRALDPFLRDVTPRIAREAERR
jgi:Polyketide cyclase / dehydrase and lipid transport